MTSHLFQYYSDHIFYIDDIIKKEVCVVLYIYTFDFITHF